MKEVNQEGSKILDDVYFYYIWKKLLNSTSTWLSLVAHERNSRVILVILTSAIDRVDNR